MKIKNSLFILSIALVAFVSVTLTSCSEEDPQPKTEKQDQTISFDPLEPVIFGEVESIELEATASSNLVVTYESDNAAVATISGNTVTIVGAGDVYITASQTGNDEFNEAPKVTRKLVVNSPAKQNQTITFPELAEKTMGDAAFELEATASSNLAVTYVSSNTSVATISGNTVTIVGVGFTDITASQTGNDDFNSAPDVIRALVVVAPPKQDQTINFGALAQKTVGDAPYVLSATATSGLTVTYTSSNTAVAIVTPSGSVTIVGAGTTTITASQAGNEEYNAATSVQQELVVIEATIPVDLSAIQAEIVGMKFDIFKVEVDGITMNEGDICGNTKMIGNWTLEFTSNNRVTRVNQCNSYTQNLAYTLTYTNGIFNIILYTLDGSGNPTTTVVANAHFNTADFLNASGNLKNELKGTFKQTNGAWNGDPTVYLKKI